MKGAYVIAARRVLRTSTRARRALPAAPTRPAPGPGTRSGSGLREASGEGLALPGTRFRRRETRLSRPRGEGCPRRCSSSTAGGATEPGRTAGCAREGKPGAPSSRGREGRPAAARAGAYREPGRGVGDPAPRSGVVPARLPARRPGPRPRRRRSARASNGAPRRLEEAGPRHLGLRQARDGRDRGHDRRDGVHLRRHEMARAARGRPCRGELGRARASRSAWALRGRGSCRCSRRRRSRTPACPTSNG